MFQLQSILEDHERLKESREKKAREKAEKEAKRLAELQVTIGDCGTSTMEANILVDGVVCRIR